MKKKNRRKKQHYVSQLHLKHFSIAKPTRRKKTYIFYYTINSQSRRL